MPIFNGTIDNDLLDGTPDADTIIGFAGNDTIFGREGNDLLNGNQGEDTVKGGDGDDWVRGGQDNDELFGDAGNDTLHGDRGNDTAFGGDGDDQLFGDTGVEANFTGNGNDILYGGLGNDSLFGLAGNDLLLGSDGNDFFCGNKGNDTVFGEDDDDLIRGGQDNDLLFGGAGNDVIFGDLGTDTVTGGEGNDTFIIGRRFDVPGFRTTGGLTIADADSITDFIKGQDLIELIGGLTFEELNIFNGSGTNLGNTIIQDKFTGEYLAILQGIDASNIIGTDFIPPGITPPSVGTLQFSAANFSINENGTPVSTITITRTDGSSGAIGVQVILNGGSAIGGSPPLAAPKDYDNSFITVNWADGDTSPKTVTVPLFNDTEVEGNETVNLTLGFPTGGATIGTQNTAIITIVDNDTQPIPGTLSFTSANYSDNEGNSGTPNKIVGTIQRTGGSDRTVTVQVQLDEGSTATPNDFTNNLPITVTFNPGETSKTVELPILGDTIPEGDDTINLKLVNPTNGASLGTQQTATYTIVNDDIVTDPEIEVLDGATNITDGTATVINFGTTTVNTPAIKTFTVKNTGNAALSLSGINLPDGFSLVGNLPSSIAAGSDTTFQVQLNANATGNFNGTLQFTNNDSNENPFDFPIVGTVEPPPTVSITATDSDGAEVGNNTGNFRITRTGNTGGALTVNLAIDASSTVTSNAGGAFPVDYNFSVSGGGSISGTGANRSLIIPDGQSSVDLIVTPANDEHAEADETLKLNLASGNYTIDGTNNNGTVTILANDTLVINTNDIYERFTFEGGSVQFIPLTASEYLLREGTLRQAMLNAISLPGADTVSFTGGGASGTINIAAPLPFLDGANANNTTLDGPGANVLTVQRGDTTRTYGIFMVGSGVTATISGLTITKGDWTLGGFLSGGGIYNDGGTVDVINSTISGNIGSTFSNRGGGGIYNKDGTVNVTNSTISDNKAGNVGGQGGGIYNENGTVNVTNSTISGNTGNGIFGGGGIYSDGGTINITDSTISNNTANLSGGGIYGRNNSTVTVTDSTISGNKAVFGGGISNFGGNLTVSNSTISGNTAQIGGGGIDNQGNSSLNITNSTIANNSASQGGGINNGGTANITNSTISGNTAQNFAGGGISNGGTVNAKNTIIAGNTVTNTSPFSSPDFAGTLTSQGYNLIGNTTGTTITGDTTGNILNVAANLGSLQNNGGPTQTMALLADSPAINAGDPNFTPPPDTDQRGTGFNRVNGGRLDIGAFESNLVPAPTDLEVTQTVSNNAPLEGSNIIYTIGVTNNGGQNATGVQLTDLLPTGLIYVSDRSGGAYNPSSGIWNIGNLNNGASTTLNITARVAPGTLGTTITNNAEVAASGQTDPNPSNNQSNLNITVVGRKILNPTPAAIDRFGDKVAIAGNNVLIGAHLDDTGATDAGSAYLFDATTGALRHTLNNPTPAAGDEFGFGVAMSGNNALVGAWRDDTGATDAGSAYLFDAATGSLTRTFNNPNPARGSFSVPDAVIIDGNNVLIGTSFAGKAYLFNTTTGSLVRTFNSSNPVFDDHFGATAAISGNKVLIGDYWDDTGANNAGVAYLFDATTGALLRTFNNPTPAADDWFGSAVAVSDNYVLIGASFDDTGATNTGAAYLFDANTGALLRTFTNPTPGPDDMFASRSVAISGNNILIGAYNDDTGATDAGSAYLFDATTGALLRTFNNPNPVFGDTFGYSVGIDGNKVLIGAPGDDTGANVAGAAYQFLI